MTEEEWAGALHWKTWVLAGLDVCISTIKCAHSREKGQGFGHGAPLGSDAVRACTRFPSTCSHHSV